MALPKKGKAPLLDLDITQKQISDAPYLSGGLRVEGCLGFSPEPDLSRLPINQVNLPADQQSRLASAINRYALEVYYAIGSVNWLAQQDEEDAQRHWNSGIWGEKGTAMKNVFGSFSKKSLLAIRDAATSMYDAISDSANPLTIKTGSSASYKKETNTLTITSKTYGAGKMSREGATEMQIAIGNVFYGGKGKILSDWMRARMEAAGSCVATNVEPSKAKTSTVKVR